MRQTGRRSGLQPGRREHSKGIETDWRQRSGDHTEVPKGHEELMQRSDGRPSRHVALDRVHPRLCGWRSLLLGFLVVCPVLCRLRRPSRIVERLRWHECGTERVSDALDERRGVRIASFMLMRDPVQWRWSHARHHGHHHCRTRCGDSRDAPLDLLKGDADVDRLLGFSSLTTSPFVRPS